MNEPELHIIAQSYREAEAFADGQKFFYLRDPIDLNKLRRGAKIHLVGKSRTLPLKQFWAEAELRGIEIVTG